MNYLFIVMSAFSSSSSFNTSGGSSSSISDKPTYSDMSPSSISSLDLARNFLNLGDSTGSSIPK